MDLKEKFEKRIKKKEEEITDLKRKIGEAEAYIQATQDSIKDLLKNDPNGAGAGTLRKGSMCYKAHELLKSTSKPMHIKAIIEGIGMEFNKKTRSSLRGSLGPYLRNNRVFKLIAPNTFGLIELAYEEEQKEEPEETNKETTNIEPF